MSSFYCEKCNALCSDTRNGYVTGCEHHPPNADSRSEVVIAMQPVRLQRKRTKGFRLVSPNGLPVVCVTRPSKWGNQFGREGSRAAAVQKFKEFLSRNPHVVAEIQRELNGKNVACYCPLSEPCHGDVYLSVAAGRGIY